MKTSFFKRLTAGILSFIMLMSAVNFSAFADFVIGTDSNKQKLCVSYFNSYYDFGGTNGTSIKGSIIKLNKNSPTGDVAYCIDARVSAPNTGTQTTYEGKDWDKYTSLSQDQRRYINYAIMYGYLGTQKYSNYGCTANDERIKQKQCPCEFRRCFNLPKAFYQLYLFSSLSLKNSLRALKHSKPSDFYLSVYFT